MQCFRLSGGIPLLGTVKAAGSKNAALPLLAASLLVEGKTLFRRVPALSDVASMTRLLESLGAQTNEGGGEVLRATSGDICISMDGPSSAEADYDLVRRMRGSICAMGPLLARFGRARMPLPGGCVIGTRPVDLHLKGFAALGAEVTVDHGMMEVVAPPQGLKGVDMELIGPQGSTVLGTANVMMAALGASGCTRIRGAAKEPEVQAVGHYLNLCGAQISGLGSDIIEIQGHPTLVGKEFTIPADRIEVGTLVLAAAITRGEVKISECLPHELEALLTSLVECGVPVSWTEDSISVAPYGGKFSGITLTTAPYPGFPTDLQAQWLVFATQCEGQTKVEEGIYPERFLHAAELNRMGAEITVSHGTALVNGPRRLSGAPVMASDLRASAALVLAGLAAEGETIIRRVYHLDRGYESMEKKLQLLGAKVSRHDDDRPA